MRFLAGFFSLQWLRVFDFLAPLAIRLLLAPILWVSGSERLGLFSGSADLLNPLNWVDFSVVQANAEAFPAVFGVAAVWMVFTIGIIEVVSSILVAIGFATRWAALALMLMFMVLIVVSLGDSSPLESAQSMLWQHGYIIQQHSPLEILLTYFVLALSLFFMGAGRWFSLDWYIYRRFTRSERRYSRRPVRSGATSAQHSSVDPFEIDATDEPGLQPARSRSA